MVLTPGVVRQYEFECCAWASHGEVDAGGRRAWKANLMEIRSWFLSGLVPGPISAADRSVTLELPWGTSHTSCSACTMAWILAVRLTFPHRHSMLPSGVTAC